MITVAECRKYLKDTKLSDARIEQIRDYLYALGREIIKKNIQKYERDIRKTTKRK